MKVLEMREKGSATGQISEKLGICGLPCNFKPLRDEPDRRLGTILALVIMAACILFIFIVSCVREKKEPVQVKTDPVSAVSLLRQQHHELTAWQELQMAICLTESRFNPAAVGAAGDRGIMQITPIYVEEANRLAGTNYTPADAHDIGKTLEMFEIIQSVYNPTHDRDLAIRYHNRSAAYKATVLRNLELVHRYEVVRKSVKK